MFGRNPVFDPSRHLPWDDDPEICEICGRSYDLCECPECPICGCYGDPDCYGDGEDSHIPMTPELTAKFAEHRERMEREQKEEMEAEIAMEKNLAEADATFNKYQKTYAEFDIEIEPNPNSMGYCPVSWAI